jgi:hypothetical protein
MSELPDARPTGGSRTVILTGLLLMWDGKQPVTLRVIGRAGGDVIPLFTSKERLEQFAKEFNCTFERIRKVDDHHVFLDEIMSQRIGAIIDPRRSDDGKVLYTEVRPDLSRGEDGELRPRAVRP